MYATPTSVFLKWLVAEGEICPPRTTSGLRSSRNSESSAASRSETLVTLLLRAMELRLSFLPSKGKTCSGYSSFPKLLLPELNATRSVYFPDAISNCFS